MQTPARMRGRAGNIASASLGAIRCGWLWTPPRDARIGRLESELGEFAESHWACHRNR